MRLALLGLLFIPHFFLCVLTLCSMLSPSAHRDQGKGAAPRKRSFNQPATTPLPSVHVLRPALQPPCTEDALSRCCEMRALRAKESRTRAHVSFSVVRNSHVRKFRKSLTYFPTETLRLVATWVPGGYPPSPVCQRGQGEWAEGRAGGRTLPSALSSDLPP